MPTPEVKIVVLGSGGVGKSAVTVQFVRGDFTEEYNPTIEDSFRKQLVVDGEPVLLDIMDTAGQEDFSTMRDQYLAMGQGVLLVYAVNDMSTFQELKRFYHQVEKVWGSKGEDVIPGVVIGNKVDLPNRQVEQSMLKELSTEWDMPAFETSAKLRINVDEAFQELVREIRKISKAAEGSNTKGSKPNQGCAQCTLM